MALEGEDAVPSPSSKPEMPATDVTQAGGLRERLSRMLATPPILSIQDESPFYGSTGLEVSRSSESAALPLVRESHAVLVFSKEAASKMWDGLGGHASWLAAHVSEKLCLLARSDYIAGRWAVLLFA